MDEDWVAREREIEIRESKVVNDYYKQEEKPEKKECEREREKGAEKRREKITEAIRS